MHLLVETIRDEIADCNLQDLRYMLETNGFPTHGSRDTLVARVASGMLFGVVSPCATCGESKWRADKVV